VVVMACDDEIIPLQERTETVGDDADLQEVELCEEVSLNLAYRWFCRLDLDDAVPDHSSFSKNRHGRFRDSDLLRGVFERVVGICLAVGLIKGEGFAVDGLCGRCERH
jgi:transposase